MTKLYVIEKPGELIGKTIAYAEMNESKVPLVLITTDGGIIAWETLHCDWGGETVFYGKEDIEHLLSFDKVLYYNIVNNGICEEKDMVDFLAKYTEKQRKEEEERERERKEFELPF